MWGNKKRTLNQVSPLRLQRNLVWGFLIGLVLALTGCVTLPDTETAQTQTRQAIGTITPSRSMAQTFTARRPGLNGITLWLEPETAEGQIHVTLQASPTAPPLATTQLEIAHLPQHGHTHVDFPHQPNSAQKTYYLKISAQAGEAKVLGRDEDAYPEGEAFVDEIPVAGDIAFRLTYAYTLRAFAGDVWGSAGAVWLLFPLTVILLLPGWLALRWTKLAANFDVGEQIALSVGLSLAILPLVMLWTSILNLAWTQTGVIVAGIVLLLLAGFQLLKHPPAFRHTLPHAREEFTNLQLPTSNLQPPTSNLQLPISNLHTLALLTIFLLSLAVRLIMVRDLVVPAWVDSVHHGLITRYILESGGFPESFAPHFPPDVNHYHLGYHSILATFTWMTNLDLPRAMLILGQVLNALTVFATYAFTRTLTGKKKAALAAALITGIFTPMPAYYASWGRYTQLTGLLILPVGLAFAKLVRLPSPPAPPSPQPSPKGRGSRSPLLVGRFACLGKGLGVRDQAKLIMLTSLTFGGLFLVHYRTTAFLGVALLVYALVESSFTLKKEGKSRLEVLKNFATTLLPAGVLAGLITMPWLFPALSDLFLPKAQAWSGETKPLFEDFQIRYLTAGLGNYTLILAGLGLVWAFLKKKKFAFTLTLWIAILFALANVGVLALPGFGFINNTSVEIALFLPISLLGGYLIGEISDFVLSKFDGRGKITARWGLFLLLAGATVFGIREILTILNPSTVFFHAADREALTWIEEHIPQEETILINPTGWGYGLYRGEDGGAWIPPLAGNPTIPPPVLYGLGAEKRRYVNQFVTAVQTTHQNPGELAQVLNGYGVKYIYLGRKGGILSPTLLGESEYFTAIFEGEGTWVFEVVGVP